MKGDDSLSVGAPTNTWTTTARRSPSACGCETEPVKQSRECVQRCLLPPRRAARPCARRGPTSRRAVGPNAFHRRRAAAVRAVRRRSRAATIPSADGHRRWCRLGNHTNGNRRRWHGNIFARGCEPECLSSCCHRGGHGLHRPRRNSARGKSHARTAQYAMRASGPAGARRGGRQPARERD